jgi:integrase
MTVSDLGRVWLDNLSGAVAGNTLWSYRSVFRHAVAPSRFGALPVVAVSPQDVRDFLLDERRRGRAPGTVRLTKSVVSLIMQEAIRRGWLLTNPVSRLWRHVPPELSVRADPDRQTPPPGVSTAIAARVRLKRPRLAWIVATYQATGCRRNEALGLQADDLDFTAGVLTIRRQWHGAGRVGPPKGRRPRTIDMATDLVDVLRDALADSDQTARSLGRDGPRWVFRAPQTGVPWHPSFVGRAIGLTSAEVCGERFGPRSFRHAVATKLLYDGEAPRYVQLLLGHQHLATTMTYVAHRGLRRREAVDRLRGL